MDKGHFTSQCTEIAYHRARSFSCTEGYCLYRVYCRTFIKKMDPGTNSLDFLLYIKKKVPFGQNYRCIFSQMQVPCKNKLKNKYQNIQVIKLLKVDFFKSIYINIIYNTFFSSFFFFLFEIQSQSWGYTSRISSAVPPQRNL